MTTTAANTGDPLGHPGFVREEEEVEEERYDSDSDDDDVDRYVFLARQPAPGDASDDDDDDAIPGGGGGGVGGRGRKRYVPEILNDAPPAAKKARPDLAAPRRALAEESGSENPMHPAERFRGGLDQEKKKKRPRSGGEPQLQRAVRGKNGPDIQASQGPQHRDVTAGQKSSVATATAKAEGLAGAPRRFVCSLCGKCFGSYQALGGHVHLGHTKKAKTAHVADGAGHGKEKALVAAAACLQDVDGSSGDGDSDEEMFVDAAANHGDHRGNANSIVQEIRQKHRCDVCGKECLSGQALGGHMRMHRKLSPHAGKERISPEVVDGAGHGQEKIAVAASPREPDGDGKNIFSAAAYRQGVDSSTDDSNSDDKMFIDAANHRGKGNVEGKVTVATGHDDADNNGNGTESKVAGIGTVNSIVRKHYRCEVCGYECLSGRALGGHMRKHPKLPPHNGGKKRTSPEKTTVAESPEESDGDEKITSAAACHEDVDSSSGDSDSNSNDEMLIDAGNHRGKGNVEGEKLTVAASHHDADGNGDHNGTERKAAVGRCHELATGAIGNASSIVSKTLHYRCEMCGKEYLSGQALGGHMRKHRKLAPHDGERRSPEVNEIPNQRAAVITGKTTNSQYGTPFDGRLIGWL